MSIENHKKHSLGHRAFFLFFARRIKLPIFLFLLAWGAFYIAQWFPAGYSVWGNAFAELLLFVAVAYTTLVLAFTYLEYRVYTYMFTDEAFVMTSGFAMRNEVAALYHQIQNVNINRSPMNRIIGVSEIVIFMTGSDKETAHAKIILPAVGKARAKIVQQELLVRARRHVPHAVG